MWSTPSSPPQVTRTVVRGLAGELHCEMFLPSMQLPLKQAQATVFPFQKPPLLVTSSPAALMSDVDARCWNPY